MTKSNAKTLYDHYVATQQVHAAKQILDRYPEFEEKVVEEEKPQKKEKTKKIKD